MVRYFIIAVWPLGSDCDTLNGAFFSFFLLGPFISGEKALRHGLSPFVSCRQLPLRGIVLAPSYPIATVTPCLKAVPHAPPARDSTYEYWIPTCRSQTSAFTKVGTWIYFSSVLEDLSLGLILEMLKKWSLIYQNRIRDWGVIIIHSFNEQSFCSMDKALKVNEIVVTKCFTMLFLWENRQQKFCIVILGHFRVKFMQ